MNTNLDTIALDLYGKIQTRFPDIKIGDENAEVLSKKADIPQARFFEFEYEENGEDLGTVAITLDEDDGIVMQISGDLADSNHSGAFKFIRSFRQFAKDRLLNFDVQNIGKDNLDKRDYHFRAKPKEEMMEPMMESKMYGTVRMSYQDLGEARIIVKHSQPINPDFPAGRTQHIEGIWVENAQGERFKYPYKHLNGARALAEHLKHGGIPYDDIGKHICSLSEELAQLRKFKGYVTRNEALSEAMGDITSKVMERIEAVKKEVHGLSRTTYYEQFAESFASQEDKLIPEEIMSDWIDRLTIRTFNEDLKTAFPYIFRLVDETSIPTKELSPDDLLDEASSPAQQAAIAIAKKKAKKVSEDPEDQFESFIDSIVKEDEDGGENTLFSPNHAVQQSAIDQLNKILSAELQGGPEGINAIESLKGLIDDPEFLDSLKDLDPDLDTRPLIQQYVLQQAPNIASQLEFGDNEPIGGQDIEPAPDTSAAAPAPEAEPAPDLSAEAPAPEAEPAPVAESTGSHPKARMIKAIHTAKKHGAKLDTTLDFGHREMTLHDCIEECGMSPEDFGFDQASNEDGVHQMLKSIAGFWNHENKNFTIGGTRAKTKVVKSFKDGEFPNANEQDLHKVMQLIDKMDPSGQEHAHQPYTMSEELNHIKKLSGI